MATADDLRDAAETATAKNSLSQLLEHDYHGDLAEVLTSTDPDTTYYHHSLEKWEVLEFLCCFNPEHLMSLGEKFQGRIRVIRDMRRKVGIPWTAWDTVGTSTLLKCEQLVIGDGLDPDFVHRDPKTATQMLKYTDMINRLVDGLLIEAWAVSEEEAPGSHPALDSPDSVMTMTRLLRSDGYPRYNHPDLDPQKTVETRARLNDVNLKILAEWAPPFREKCVAKICFNILVSDVPPGIQNYNTLILAFTLLGEHRLAQVVVDSFLYDSHMKPTEATLLCLLHHYRLRNDIVGFWGIIRRIFGHDPRGIGLRRRKEQELATDKEVRRWTEQRDVVAVKGMLLELPQLTQNLVESIMEGLVDFGLLREATKLMVVCLQEGWEIDPDLLDRMLFECVNGLEVSASRILIQGFIDHYDRATSMIIGPAPLSINTVRKLRLAMNIGYSGSPRATRRYEPGFGAWVPESVEPKARSTDKRLMHIVTAVWIREALHHVRMMTFRCKRILNRFAQVKPNVRWARTQLEVIDWDAERTARKLVLAERVKRMARLSWIELRIGTYEKAIREVQREFICLLEKRLPKEIESLVPYIHNLKHRARFLAQFYTPGTGRYFVASFFLRKKEIDRQIKYALLDALPPARAKAVWKAMRLEGDQSVQNTIAHFELYLKRLARRADPGRTEMAEETATPARGWAGTFSGLVASLPKPSIQFWRRPSRTGAVSSGGQ